MTTPETPNAEDAPAGASDAPPNSNPDTVEKAPGGTRAPFSDDLWADFD